MRMLCSFPLNPTAMNSNHLMAAYKTCTPFREQQQKSRSQHVDAKRAPFAENTLQLVINCVCENFDETVETGKNIQQLTKSMLVDLCITTKTVITILNRTTTSADWTHIINNVSLDEIIWFDGIKLHGTRKRWQKELVRCGGRIVAFDEQRWPITQSFESKMHRFISKVTITFVRR